MLECRRDVDATDAEAERAFVRPFNEVDIDVTRHRWPCVRNDQVVDQEAGETPIASGLDDDRRRELAFVLLLREL